MIIYSEDRLVPTDVNMMVIRGKENIGFFYIHRSLYDQAVVLYDLYGDNPLELVKELTGKDEMREDTEYFIDNTPQPISIFGPFLMLVDDLVEDFDDMVGAIHVMSGPLNLRKMLKVPVEMRNTPAFSLSIKEEYQVAWDRFLQTTMPYSPDMYRQPGLQPLNGVQTTVTSSGEFHTEEEEEQFLEDFLFSDDPDFDPFKRPDDFDEDAGDAEEEEPAVVSGANTEYVPEPEPEPEPEEEKTGVEALIGGYL